MGNQFYAPGADRAEKVNDLFAGIATRYDLINDLQSFGLHRLWKRRLIRLARVQRGDRALDLCCGTGDVTFALAATGARATGLDFSEPMLAVAREKLKVLESIRTSGAAIGTCSCSHEQDHEKVLPLPAGLPVRRKEFAAGESPLGPEASAPESLGRGEGERVASNIGTQTISSKPTESSADSAVPEFIHGDALNTPFPDASFDAVTISYGLRNLASVEGGLREMWRVARPGARLLVLDFGKPDNALWRAVYFAYLRCVVPVFGWLFCRNSAAYAYILESVKHYPAQHGVAEIMQKIGCQNIRIINLLGGMMSINYGEKPE